jgi:quercetin dioxygenase-like cupin family protein
MATFSPDSTLDWHKHLTGQLLIVVEGEGILSGAGKR